MQALGIIALREALFVRLQSLMQLPEVRALKIFVVKFDGLQSGGRQSCEQQGAPWIVKAPSRCTMQRLADLVEKKALAQGVCENFFLTNGSGYRLTEETEVDVTSPSRKILAGTLSNFEKHLGPINLSLVEQLACSSPKKRPSKTSSAEAARKAIVTEN